MPVIPGIPFYSRPGIPDIHMNQLNNKGFLSLNRLEACLNRETEDEELEALEQ